MADTNGFHEKVLRLEKDMDSIGSDLKLHIHDTDEKMDALRSDVAEAKAVCQIHKSEMAHVGAKLLQHDAKIEDIMKRQNYYAGGLALAVVLVAPIVTALIIHFIAN